MPFATDAYLRNSVVGHTLCNILYSHWRVFSEVSFHSLQLPYKPKCRIEIMAQEIGNGLVCEALQHFPVMCKGDDISL